MALRVPVVSDVAFGCLAYARKEDLSFGKDIMFRKLFLKIISECQVSSFVETGTFRGDSTSCAAKAMLALPVYTCELNKASYEYSKRRLKKFQHVTVRNLSSDRFLLQILEEGALGLRPLFFLDAHWYAYWPLADEMHAITSRLEKAIVIIHDFQVPGRTDFTFDCYTSACNLDMIRPHLRSTATYNLLFPAYEYRDAFPPTGSSDPLRGYVVIFQNLPDTFAEFTKDDFVAKSFHIERL